MRLRTYYTYYIQIHAGSSLYWYGTLVPGDTGQLDHGRDADGDGVLPAADGGQLNPGTPAAGARAIHTDRQGQGVGACASDRGRGLSAPPFPPTMSCFPAAMDAWRPLSTTAARSRPFEPAAMRLDSLFAYPRG